MKPVITILAVNTGSSSIKFSLYESGETEELLFSGSLTRIGLKDGRFSVVDPEGHFIDCERVNAPGGGVPLRLFVAPAARQRNARRGGASGGVWRASPHLDLVQLFEHSLHVAYAHASEVHGQNFFVESIEVRLALRNQLRLETAVAVAWL